MKIFDHTNPRHLQILKEELARAKKILNEEYSADRVWDAMSEEEQKEALSATTDDGGPERADEWTGAKWDEIPADIQDAINLTDYELAIDDRTTGRVMLRGIKNAQKENPELANQFIQAFLKKIGRSSLESITTNQSQKLNIGLYRFIQSSQSTSNTDTSGLTTMLNPRDLPSGAPSKNTDWRGGMWTGD